MPLSDTPPILEAAIEQSEYAVVITTADLEPPGPRIEYVNAAYSRMTGYASEEILSATPRIQQGPATERHVLDRLKTALRAGDSYVGDTWNYTKDGTPYRVEWTVTPVRLHGDGIDYYLSVQRDITTLYQTQEKLEGETRRLSALLESSGGDRDAVTGALNHRGTVLRLQGPIDEASDPSRVTGLVALHLRRLDRIDQAFGVAAIHELLSDIGERLNKQFAPSESLARCHDNTFAVIVPAAVDSASDADDHLMARALALVAAVREGGFSIAGNPFQVEVGAGIARAPTDSCDAHQIALLAQRAADTDEDLVRWPDATTMASQRQQLALEQSLRRAIDDRELLLHYQPIIDLASGEVEGAEALARWPQPEGHAPIGPGEFIPLAEALGLMDQLGMQVFEAACHQLRA